MTSHLLLALIINPSLILRKQKIFYQVETLLEKLLGGPLEGQSQGKTAIPRNKTIGVVLWQVEGTVDPDRPLFVVRYRAVGNGHRQRRERESLFQE